MDHPSLSFPGHVTLILDEALAIDIQVPKNTKSSSFLVAIDSHRIVVKHKETGQVYLDGDLWKGIIPEESLWINGNGDGENGFVIQLTKMNLELLAESWEHSHTWWEKLFTTENYRQVTFSLLSMRDSIDSFYTCKRWLIQNQMGRL